jgi:hypothetical protein
MSSTKKGYSIIIGDYRNTWVCASVHSTTIVRTRILNVPLVKTHRHHIPAVCLSVCQTSRLLKTLTWKGRLGLFRVIFVLYATQCWASEGRPASPRTEKFIFFHCPCMNLILVYLEKLLCAQKLKESRIDTSSCKSKRKQAEVELKHVLNIAHRLIFCKWSIMFRKMILFLSSDESRNLVIYPH